MMPYQVIILGFFLFCLGLVIYLAWEKIILILGVRNIVLRKKYAVLVILGLMIGTAVITSSLVVGDTMTTMVESEVLDSYHTIDEKIVGIKPTGERGYFNESLFYDLWPSLNVSFIDGVSPSIRDWAAILNLETNLSDPRVLLVGIDFFHGDAFGNFYNLQDRQITQLNDSECMMTEQTARDLDAQAGDRIVLYAMGAYRIFPLAHILSSRERGGTGTGVFVTLSTAQELVNKTGMINEILISNRGGVQEGLVYTKNVQSLVESLEFPSDLDFQLGVIKQQILDENRESMQIFTDMFLVFGSFSIIAGIILIINIFVMLAQERKSEMGMVRAIGMQQKHLKKMYLSEGCIYAALSSLTGVFLGVGIGYIIMSAVSMILRGFDVVNIVQYFTVTPLSMVLGFISGFMITLGTIYVTAHRISHLNIVRAIRDIPEPPVRRHDTRIFCLGVILGIISIILLAVARLTSQASLLLTGISLLVFSQGFIIRRYIGDRWAFNAVSLSLLILWFLPSQWFPSYSGGIEMFIFSGLFLIVACLMLVMFNSIQITQIISFLIGWGKSRQAVLKTALSYSLRSRFRTGMTIAIFALIIFSITTMSMIVGIFGTNIGAQVDKAAGGYDILAFSLPSNPIINISQELQHKDLDSSIQDAVGVLQSQVTLSLQSQPNETFHYAIIGVNQDFITHGSFTFEKTLDPYQEADEIWQALRDNSSLIVIDATVLGEQFGPPGSFTTDVGDVLYLRDVHNNTYEKKIIGILDTTLMQAVFSFDFYIQKDFGITGPTFFLFNVKDTANVKNLSKNIESSFLHYGLQVLDLENMVLEAVYAMNQFFNLFQSYMALGLVIGIAGLGIITIRSVHERRQEIGMMRALGFKRKMVLYSFMIETSFIALIGITIGALLGILTGFLVWRDAFASQGLEFMINWHPILFMSLLSFLVTLFCIIPASQKASHVPPAEALRYRG